MKVSCAFSVVSMNFTIFGVTSLEEHGSIKAVFKNLKLSLKVYFGLYSPGQLDLQSILYSKHVLLTIQHMGVTFLTVTQNHSVVS